MEILSTFIAIDLETADAHNSRPCSLGLAVVKDGEIVKTEYHLINPECLISYHAYNVHHLTDDDVKDAPTFAEVWGKISHLFDEIPVIVAHNAHFDFTVLRKVAAAYDIQLPELSVFCTQRTAEYSSARHYSCKLADLCSEFDVPLERHHNALDDAVAAAKLMLALQLTEGAEAVEWRIRDNSTAHSSTSRRHSDGVIYPNIQYDDVNIDFKDHIFVLTGNIPGMKRTLAEAQILMRGGRLRSSVTRDTDYLIVGCEDLSAVKSSSGISSKLKKALENRENGKDVKIVHCGAFSNQLDAVPPLRNPYDYIEYVLQKETGIISNSTYATRQLYCYTADNSTVPTRCKLVDINSTSPLILTVDVGGEEINIAKDFLLEQQPTKDEATAINDILDNPRKRAAMLSDSEKNLLQSLTLLLDERFLKSAKLRFAEKRDKSGNLREADRSEYKSIVISAEPTAYRLNSTAEPLLCRVKFGKSSKYISFAPQHRKALDKYNIPYDNAASDQFLRIDLSVFFSNLLNEDLKNAINEVFAAAFSFAPFGCCSKFKECSIAGKCQHDDFIYASAACQYKKHLDNGEVFYRQKS